MVAARTRLDKILSHLFRYFPTRRCKSTFLRAFFNVHDTSWSSRLWMSEVRRTGTYWEENVSKNKKSHNNSSDYSQWNQFSDESPWLALYLLCPLSDIVMHRKLLSLSTLCVIRIPHRCLSECVIHSNELPHSKWQRNKIRGRGCASAARTRQQYVKQMI